jgi:SIT4 phosphatase-associated protein
MDGGLGDIWSTKAFAYESPLKDLLDSENYTVEQLLEQDELLQELRGMHPTLIEYFSQEESLIKLIKHIIQEPLPLEPVDSISITENPNLKITEGEVDEWEAQTPPTPYYTTRDVKVLRYPYVACEVICSEINAILDTVVDGQISRIVSSSNYEKVHIEDVHHSKPITILDLLFSLVYSAGKGQLDDYRAGYFDKILTVLCRTRPLALSSYLNEGGGKGRLVLMKAMINHLYSHSVLQIVQRLMMPNSSTFYSNGEAQSMAFANNDDCQEDPQNLFRSKWADSPEGVDMLLNCLLNVGDESNYELFLSEAQNASEVLITMIQNSPLMSPILLRLTQEPILPQLMNAASSEEQTFSPHDNRLTCAMSVLEALILQLGGYGSVNSEDDGTVRQQIPMANADTLILHLPSLLDRLKKLLRHDSTRLWSSPMQFSSEPQPILGTSRLRIVRLVESLVLLGNIQVDRLLCQSDILQACLDLFWEFEWNSMLHQSVANLLVHVFEGQNSRCILQKYFLLDCNLLQRLIESFECEKEEELSSPGLADSNDEADILPISDEDIDTVIASQQEGANSSDETTSDEAVPPTDNYDAIERDPRDRWETNLN